MAKLVHTVSVSDGKGGTRIEKRVSESRAYTACVVATVTEATIQRNGERCVAAGKSYEETTAKLNELMAALGMTVEQATAQHEADSARWYDKTDGVFPTFDKLRMAAGKPHAHITQFEKAIKADLVARGLSDPYDTAGAFGIVEAHQDATRLARALAGWKTPVLGSQCVLSWHSTPALASKATGSREASSYRESFYALSVRTDITVTEKAKRAPKAV